MDSAESLFENVAAGILACRRGLHLAARKSRSPGNTFKFYRSLSDDHSVPSGWKPRLYVSQDGRRCLFQTGSDTHFGNAALKAASVSGLT